MKTFKKHLKKELKDKTLKKLYEEEKELLAIAIKISEERTNQGLSQKDLAIKANITQQQLSKVENGINCNLSTFLKVCHALNIQVGLKKIRV